MEGLNGEDSSTSVRRKPSDPCARDGKKSCEGNFSGEVFPPSFLGARKADSDERGGGVSAKLRESSTISGESLRTRNKKIFRGTKRSGRFLLHSRNPLPRNSSEIILS